MSEEKGERLSSKALKPGYVVEVCLRRGAQRGGRGASLSAEWRVIGRSGLASLLYERS
jgi:hypothetical protein